MKTDQVYMEKTKRLADGHAPRLLDLFAGCGDISLGFEHAGFEIVVGAGIYPLATQSHALKFFRHQKEDDVARHALPVDITQAPLSPHGRHP